MTPETRTAVVAEAMSWLRTPYHHHARVKGVGVDCAQLPIGVYSAVGLIEPVKPSYVRDWHLHRGEELYLQWVLRYAVEIDRADVLPGDLGLWKFGRTFSHGAIAVEPPLFVHAWIDRGVELVDIDRDEEMRARDARFFTLGGA